MSTPTLFRGESRDAFDGEIKEVDLRGKIHRAKLVLTGGGQREIDCIFRGYSVEQIREVLDRRVWAEGMAIYDGTSELPARLEIDRTRIISGGGDLLEWRGKVAPFESDWDTEFDR